MMPRMIQAVCAAVVGALILVVTITLMPLNDDTIDGQTAFVTLRPTAAVRQKESFSWCTGADFPYSVEAALAATREIFAGEDVSRMINVEITSSHMQLLLTFPPPEPRYGYARAKLPQLPKAEVDLLFQTSDPAAPHHQTFAISELEVDEARQLVNAEPYRTKLLAKVRSKYFRGSRAAPSQGKGQRTHADNRFFRGAVPINMLQKVVLKIFSDVTSLLKRHGIPHWLCSGALIGYHYWGNMLPWDDDVDLQVLADDLYKLRLLQLKMQLYAEQRHISNRYMIDVSPYHIFREYQPYQKVDAKIVDTQSGFLVDIMAVAPANGSSGLKWNTKYAQPKLHPEYPHLETLSVDALFPICPCQFSGVATFCPHNITKHLTEDYGPNVLVRSNAPLFNYTYDKAARLFKRKV